MFVNNSRIVSTPISTILFVNMSYEEKMRLVGHNQPRNEKSSPVSCKKSHAKSTVSDGLRFVTPVSVEFCIDEVTSAS